MKEGGMQIMVDVMVPPEVLGPNGKLGSTAELQPGEVLVAQNVYLTVQKIPDSMRAKATARNISLASLEASSEISILRYQSPNKYILPLKDVWYMQAVPNVTSHHRWMFQTEFGIDFLKLDEKGSPYKTDGKSPEDYYAFGQPVLAAADGVVTIVINDAVQNWAAWLQREGESQEQFYQRSEKYQLEAMKKDLYRAVTGNLVVIEHAGGEFSGYAHLKRGSVHVKVGDKVKQGQQIAEVGDTGDYYMAHLHFQISDRPDVIKGRSLPFSFVNLKPAVELGHFGRLKN
jgi:murein DD-endopeptidase MepM/ murein hydrolase activator NlpD